MKPLHKRRRRAGAIIVFTAIMMVVMFAMLAFAVDIGYLALARTQLQTAADSAAMAGAWDLLNSHFAATEPTVAATQTAARTSSRYYAANNYIAGSLTTTLADADIVFGRLDLTAGLNAQLTFTNPSRYNAVQVRVQRVLDQNGEVPLFFAQVLGMDTAPSSAVAMAAFVDNFQGFRPPGQGEPNLPILPFALDKQTWDQLQAGGTSDAWKWNEDTDTVSSGPDGIREASLFPQDVGSPGNRGTVDLGNPNNSTNDLKRQITDGITAHDLSYLPGGELKPGMDGKIHLNGDTGMSNGMEGSLKAIIGQTRIIPIFSGTVPGNGNNATYTIVQFAGIRVMAVNLTGNPSNRYVVVQPAKVLIENGIPGPDGTEYSSYIYSKHICLVR